MRKWTICQFEWHRDNKILLPSQRTTEMLFFEDGFYLPEKSGTDRYHSFFLADKMQGIGSVIP